MIGRRATVGFSLLWALMLSALVAQSASAQVGFGAANTTAVTCVKVGVNKGEFKDAHCDDKSFPESGEFEHVAIKNDETTEIEVANEGSSKLNGVIGGVNAELICNKAASVAGKSFIHNTLNSVEIGKILISQHRVTGTIQLNFTECKVQKPLNCTVKSILTTATFEGVEGLSPGGNEMGVEFKGEGEGSTFAEVKFEGEKCSLLNGGKAFLIKGSAIATGKTATQKEKQSGATAVYETGSEAGTMETLEIGLKPQQFTGTFTTRMAGGGNPIALTTVT